MAKKSKARAQTLRPRQQPIKAGVAPRRQRLKLIIGGAVLAVALGVAGLVHFRQQSGLGQRLQGPVDQHYSRGTAGAKVVIKEFSDYT